jgi:hypothetical protein
VNRIGPHKIHTDVDDDGNLLDHWKLVGLSIAVEHIGSDEIVHYVESIIGLTCTEETIENFFQSLERGLENKMKDQGVWQ